MGKSLQDQLLKAGLIDSNQVKKANAEKRKKAKKQRHSKAEPTDGSTLSITQQRLEKSERDRQLNRDRTANAQRKEIDAQIKQLVENNQEPQDDNGIAYNFEDNNKLRRVYVSDSIRKKIISGQLAIIKYKKRYEVIPIEIARKIADRDATAVVKINDKSTSSNDENDPYSEYQIPDDLIW